MVSLGGERFPAEPKPLVGRCPILAPASGSQRQRNLDRHGDHLAFTEVEPPAASRIARQVVDARSVCSRDSSLLRA